MFFSRSSQACRRCRVRHSTFRLQSEPLEDRQLLACTYDPGLNALTSTGGDQAEFRFNWPEPGVDIVCGGTFMATSNASDFFFADFGSGTSRLVVYDRHNELGQLYSITAGGIHAGRVNLNSTAKSVMYQGVSEILLATEANTTLVSISDPGSHRLDNFPRISLQNYGTLSNNVIVDDSGYSGGDSYRVWEDRVSSTRLGDKVFFNYRQDRQVTILTGSGHDTISLDTFNHRMDTLPRVDLNSGAGLDSLVMYDTGAVANSLFAINATTASKNHILRASWNSSLEFVHLSTGPRDDSVTVGQPNQQLGSMPPVFLDDTGGMDTLRIENGGYIGNDTYFISASQVKLGASLVASYDPDVEQVEVVCGAGDTTVTMDEPTTHRLDNLARVRLFDSAGNDQIIIHDDGYSAGETYRIWDDKFSSGRLADKLFFPRIPGRPWSIYLYTGMGNDVIDMQGTNQRLEFLPAVVVRPGGGNDTLVLNDLNGGGLPNVFRFTEFAAIKNGVGRAYWDDDRTLENIQLFAGPLNDSVTLSRNNAQLGPMPTVKFFGGAGIDTLTMDDSGYTGTETYVLTQDNASVGSLGTVAQYDANVENVELVAGGGNSDITVGTSSQTLVGLPDIRVFGGQGIDRLILDDTNAANAGSYRWNDSEFYTLDGQSLITTIAADIENLELRTGAGNDIVSIVATNNVATIRDYLVSGTSGAKYINVDDTQSPNSAVPVITSTGVGIGAAVVAAGTKTIRFDHTNTVNFYNSVGASVQLAGYNSQHYQLNLFDGAIHGDFNGDGRWTVLDLDALTNRIAGGAVQETEPFDLNLDGVVNLLDRDFWLTEAGTVNLGVGLRYRLGDANLDGVVDGGDFNIWNSHKFTANSLWSRGDFNADGSVDGGDFNIWNSNKFSSALGTRYIIDFSGLPGADGIPGTPDDIPFGPGDFDTRIIDNEYASAGVIFAGMPTPGQIGGGYHPNGTPNTGDNVVLNSWNPTTGIAPASLYFATPQANVTFDLFAYLNASGTSVPVTLRANGSVVGTRLLTNADAIIGGTNPGQLGGRFRIQSSLPFDQLDMGLSQPFGGGYGIDNLNFSPPVISQQLVVGTDQEVAPTSLAILRGHAGGLESWPGSDETDASDRTFVAVVDRAYAITAMSPSAGTQGDSLASANMATGISRRSVPSNRAASADQLFALDGEFWRSGTGLG